VRKTAEAYIAWARENGRRIIVVAGRPYHIAPEINHGIDELITSFGLALITEDAVSPIMEREPRKVLNQWNISGAYVLAARYVTTQPVCRWCSWCPSAAVPTPSQRTSCAASWRTGARSLPCSRSTRSRFWPVRIRLRSLLAAIEAREEIA
jgi:hypothetical protein